MSSWFPRISVPVALLGSLLWIVAQYKSQIAGAVPFDLDLLFGVLFVVVVDWGKEIVVIALSISILWRIYQHPKSVVQLDYLPVIAIIAGILFLILTPFTSSMFYYIIPQPTSQLRFSLIRELSVIALISSILLDTLLSRLQLNTAGYN